MIYTNKKTNIDFEIEKHLKIIKKMYDLKSRMLTAASKVFIEAKEILTNLTID